MQTTRRHLAALGAGLGLAAALPLGAGGQGQAQGQGLRPLLMPGKKTLFQRVLVRPGATLSAQPGGSPLGGAAAPRPFDLFYVFARRNVGSAEWLQVGGSRDGPVAGWMPAERAIPWKQTIVVAFSNRAGRERSLIFRDAKTVERLLGDAAAAAVLREKATKGGLRPEDPVVSIEPDTFVDIHKQFYLLPILDRRTVTRGRDEATVLRVASVARPRPPSDDCRPKRFRAGVVFVIDTTISMQPYIERTREAVRRIHERLAGSPLAGRLGFGLIAFRNSMERTPAIEYVTRTFLPLAPDQDPKAVLDQLAAVREARVSTHDLREDVYAGVNEAIEKVNWEPFAGRYIVLITDSGPLPANDPASATRLDATALNDHARTRGISVAALHLITPVNRPVYPEALPALRVLCAGIGSDRSPRYYPIPNGAPPAFSDAVERMTAAMLAGLEAAAQDRPVATPVSTTAAAPAAPRDELTDKTLIDTLAMQLAYLGRQEGERAPDVVEGWLADRALERPDRAALEVQVLMTKNELSTLREVLARIIDQGEQTSLDSNLFFDRIRSALAVMARDPERLVRTEFRTLGEALGEFLEDLPYESELQSIDSTEWVRKGRAQQREILDRLNAKLRAFDRFHDDPNLWTALHPPARPGGEVPEGEKVFPLPLSSLP